jgi:hypothetical protein
MGKILGIVPGHSAGRDEHQTVAEGFAELGWEVLRLGGAATTLPPVEIDFALAHPGFGVALVDLMHPSPEPVKRLRDRLDAVGFSDAFPGHLPVIHRVLGIDDLWKLSLVLDPAFRSQAPMGITGREWIALVQQALLLEAVVPAHIPYATTALAVEESTTCPVSAPPEPEESSDTPSPEEDLEAPPPAEPSRCRRGDRFARRPWPPRRSKSTHRHRHRHRHRLWRPGPRLRRRSHLPPRMQRPRPGHPAAAGIACGSFWPRGLPPASASRTISPCRRRGRQACCPCGPPDPWSRATMARRIMAADRKRPSSPRAAPPSRRWSAPRSKNGVPFRRPRHEPRLGADDMGPLPATEARTEARPADDIGILPATEARSEASPPDDMSPLPEDEAPRLDLFGPLAPRRRFCRNRRAPP